MAESMLALAASGNAIANADGKASIVLGPKAAGERWTIKRMIVHSTSSRTPQAQIYRGTESPSSLIDGTYAATQDVSDSVIDLNSGNFVTCVFQFADDGSVCTFTVEGDQFVRGFVG